MRDDSPDTVTSGGHAAPLGARAEPESRGRSAPGGESEPRVDPVAPGRRPVRGRVPSIARIDLPSRLLLVLLGSALVAYAAVAADVVNGGGLSNLDLDVATWVAGSMPAWAEWLARPLTLLGGVGGITAVVATMTVWLLLRRARAETLLLLAVTIGVQLLVWTGKHSYERARPHVGSAIPLPSSYSFPSGHAATGIAVFGLLGILGATIVATRRDRLLAIGTGFSLGVLIGVSRVVLNVHWMTDVLAGWFLGLAWLCVCLLVALRLRR